MNLEPDMDASIRPVTALSYSAPEPEEVGRFGAAWRTTPMRIVFLCWAIPLLIGILVLAAAAITRGKSRQDIEMIGIGDVLLGMVLSAVGAVAILAFAAGRWNQTLQRNDDILVPAFSGVILLASNYFLAILFMIVGAHL